MTKSLAIDAIGHFMAVNWNVSWRLDAQLYFVTTDAQYFDRDA
jgi:hypothetical protein